MYGSSIDEVIDKYRIKYAPMPLAEEHALIKLAQAGNRKARDRLVRNNGLFAIKVATTYGKYNVPFEQLTQCAMMGLSRTIDTFDTSRGYRLISFAVWWIRAYIKREIQENSTIVRCPANWYWEKNTRDEMSAIRKTVRMDVTRNEKDNPVNLHEFFSDGSDTTGEIDEIDKILAEITADCNERERQIIRSLCGARGDGPKTLGEIADGEGVSIPRIKQIRDGAFVKCRARVKLHGLRKLGLENLLKTQMDA